MLLFQKENIQYSSMELMRRKWHASLILFDLYCERLNW